MIRIAFALCFILILKSLVAQTIAIKYFHYNYNFVGVPMTNTLSHFINSYNAFGAKPVGVSDYRIQLRPTITFGALLGFSYKGSHNLITLPIFLGETLLSSKGKDIPSPSVWVKNLDFSYAGAGIGYMGFLQIKKFKGGYQFPKVMYQFSINAEKNSFLYTDKGGTKDRRDFFNPSAIAFLQYNLYPPSAGKTRVALGINLKYHATLSPINLDFLQNDFDYLYTNSLTTTPSDISLGLSFIFLGNLNKRKTDNSEYRLVRIEMEGAVTKRKIDGRMDVREETRKRKIKPSHSQFKIKSKNHEFPILTVKAHAKGYFSKEKIIEIIVTEESDQQVYRISMNRIHPEVPLGKIYFHHATVNVADSSQAALNSIYETLEANPELKILIKGNTSAEGNSRMNLKLSRKRAALVKDFLVDKGIHKHRINTVGLGASDPVYPDDTEEHKTYNRRAEVFILQ